MISECAVENLLNNFRRRKNRPLLLPTTLRANPEDEMKEPSIQEIKKWIGKHESGILRYDYLEKLYQGFHDIFFAPEKEAWKPDNRLAVNFPRYITETFCGYGYGIPIKVTHPDEKVDAIIQDFGRDNEITDHDSEMARKCCIYGHAYEYIYQNERAETKITACSPKNVIVVYANDMTGRALFAIRYGYKSAEEYEDKKDAIKYSGEPFGEILYRDRIVHFSDGKIGEEKPNPYGYIPIVEWRLNDDRIGIYEQVAGLVESYNFTIAEKANDVDAFAEAYLEILGAEVDEEGVRRIRDDRVINFFGGDSAKDVLVQFLQKPTADGTQENLLNRLENLIYQISMVANITDDSFGTSTTGVALAYKLQAMSNLATTFDRKIEKSLRKRYKIFCSLSTNTSSVDAYRDIEIQFTRNIPRNIAEEAQVAQAVEGIVSREAQIALLSFIRDPKAELKKVEEENRAEIPTDDPFHMVTENGEK